MQLREGPAGPGNSLGRSVNCWDFPLITGFRITARVPSVRDEIIGMDELCIGSASQRKGGMPYPPRHASTKSDASDGGHPTAIEGREGDLAPPAPTDSDVNLGSNVVRHGQTT